MIYVARGYRVYIRFCGDVEPAMVESINRDGTILVRFVRDDLRADVYPEDVVYTEETEE